MARTWKLTIVIKDEKGSRSTLSLYLPTYYFTYQQAVAFAEDYIPTLGDVITGEVNKVTLSIDLGLSAGAAGPDSDVEAKMGMILVVKPWDHISLTEQENRGRRKTITQNIATWDENLTYASPLTEKRLPMFWDPLVIAFDNRYFAAVSLGHPANPSDGGRWV
jgi:hypothetical protein